MKIKEAFVEYLKEELGIDGKQKDTSKEARKQYGRGVESCNCPICQADRDGTGDIIGGGAISGLFLFILFIVGLFIAFTIFG